MRKHMPLAGLVLLGAAGCVSVTGPKAIRPGPAGLALGFEEVDTLSPVLEWEGPVSPAAAGQTSTSAQDVPEASAAQARAAGGHLRYDVAIHQVDHGPWQKRPGARVYYREGIAETSHRVEASLDPGRDYYWFVRTREGDRVGPWSRYGYFLFLGVAWMSASNQPYRFRTPRAAPSATPAQAGAAESTGTGSAADAAGGGPPF